MHKKLFYGVITVIAFLKSGHKHFDKDCSLLQNKSHATKCTTRIKQIIQSLYKDYLFVQFLLTHFSLIPNNYYL